MNKRYRISNKTYWRRKTKTFKIDTMNKGIYYTSTEIGMIMTLFFIPLITYMTLMVIGFPKNDTTT
jgi:hypothetical protein